MKTIIYILIISIIFSITAKSQTIDSVDINDISAAIASDGGNFWDGAHAFFKVPKESQVSSLFASGLWIGGIDDGGLLHIAAQTYRQSGNDFWPGPVASDYAAPGYDLRFDEVWVVDKIMIDNHITNWPIAGYIVPSKIAEWPGTGNLLNGEANILAPYFDYNNNEIYDPTNGDYPIIRGDEAAFFMYNDDKLLHTETNGEKLKIEVHGLAYAFNAPDDSALNQTLFVNYQIINRSTFNYHDLFTGFFADSDIGCYNDDWAGCDTNQNLFFAYNGDVIDSPCPYGYAFYPPAQGVQFLNQPMNYYKTFNNDYTVVGNPETADDYYEYISGYWKDGTPQTFGDEGYGGFVNSNYMYPSSPLEIDGWSFMTEALAPGDRRGLGSSGPYVLNAFDTLCLDLAFTAAFSYEPVIFDSIISYHNAHNAVEVLKLRAADITSFYNSNFPDCGINYQTNPDFIAGVEQDILVGVTIYPNPASELFFIQLDKSLICNQVVIEIINIAGEKIKHYSGLNGNSFELNIVDIAEGFYLINVYNEGVLVSRGNFVKH